MDFGPAFETYADKKTGLYGGKFFPPHNGHLAMAREAAEHVDVLFVVVQDDPLHEAELCENVPFEPIEARLRERWLTEVFKDEPNIRVLSFHETRVPDYLTNPLLVEEYKNLLKVIGHVDVVFSGENEYSEYFAHVLPGVPHQVFQKSQDVSASKIRADLYGKWEFLPAPVRRYYQKRVVLCGGESSGKTFTTRTLGEKLGLPVLPEYGRTFYNELGGYGAIELPEDFMTIATGHLQQLHYGPTESPILLVDTDMIYTQSYYLESYGEPEPLLEGLIQRNVEKVDKYIFLDPYTFADDGTRFRREETVRQEKANELFALYENYGKNPLRVSGTGEERLNTVEAAILAML